MKPWTNEEIRLVAEWFAEGIPDDVIAKRLNRTRNSVVVKRKRNGIVGDKRQRRISTDSRKKMSDARKKLPSENQPSWKGGRRVTSNGYIEIYMPSHHRSRGNGYVFEHVIVAESKYGRKIYSTEHVHHIDHNKKNNDPDNLEVLSPVEHNLRHPKIRLGKFLKCAICTEEFYRKPSHLKRAKCCSRKCLAIYNHKLNEERITHAK